MPASALATRAAASTRPLASCPSVSCCCCTAGTVGWLALCPLCRAATGSCCCLLGHLVKGRASQVPGYILGFSMAASSRAGTDTLKDLVHGLGSFVRHLTSSTPKLSTPQLSAHLVIISLIRIKTISWLRFSSAKQTMALLLLTFQLVNFM